MERYYRSNKKQIDDSLFSNDIDFQIIEWKAQDEPNDNESESEDDVECKRCGKDNSDCNCINNVYTIRCFGVTSNGLSITCKITDFKPYYYIKVPNSFGRLQLIQFQKYILDSWILKEFRSSLVSCSLTTKKDIFGFKNGKNYRFVKLTFDNYSSMLKSRYLFKKPIKIHQVSTKAVKYKLYESNFEPFLRYCHIKDIRMAGWVRLPKGKYTITQDTANTQIEVSIDRKDIVSLSDKHEMANFLQASFDIEVYSHDYTFPDPKHPKNEIFQIATTYKYYHDSDFRVKQLLTLKHTEQLTDTSVIVEECKNERELIKRWVDTISQMDPDIFYTYNGDSFDCMYLVERAKMHGLVNEKKAGKSTVQSGYFLKKLSRLTETSAEIKKEYFSSSAYGDSEYNRIYIPGRLNYDLLIHYKRGMTKYSSYKLDFIASEILGEGKHDVSAKEIFKFYETGKPEEIKKIGDYCLQDTELLQKLVDKQLILTNIVQLANVTFVPIGFLTTRGQTIKVYSQILRKARQMDFLVPHTNFNEDVHLLYIRTKTPHNLTDDHISDYIEINCGRSQTGNFKPVMISAKIEEIISDDVIAVLSDTEITRDYFNINFKKGYSEFAITRLWSPEDAVEDSFTGATVLNPSPGIYTNNIAVLDFASLYPTIMISRNLCFSTFVMNKKYEGIPGVSYEKIAWDDTVEYKLAHTCQGVGKSGKSKGQVCGKQAYFEINGGYYCRIHDPLKKTRTENDKCQKREVHYDYTIVQPSKDADGNIVNKGVIPALLEDLYAERKAVKKKMAQAEKDGNKLLANILDSTQLAIKVSLNSTYGFLGRRAGNLILKELGSIVTSVGRMLIEQSKEYAEGPFIQFVKENGLLMTTIQKKKLELSKKQQREILKNYQIT
jgi:DNA polymerase elongation subunit (family B)